MFSAAFYNVNTTLYLSNITENMYVSCTLRIQNGV